MIRVLVVDDDIGVCHVVEQFLVRRGYNVEIATRGEIALLKVQEWRPEVVLLDIVMPEMDGIEVLRRIKEIDPGVGVIMTTGLQDEDVGRQALRMGAFDFITKPFDLDYMENVLLAKIASMPYPGEKQ